LPSGAPPQLDLPEEIWGRGKDGVDGTAGREGLALAAVGRGEGRAGGGAAYVPGLLLFGGDGDG